MKPWLRRLRGVLGVGALWGVAGTAYGAMSALVAKVLSGVRPGVPLFEFLLEVGLGAGAVGFLLGSGFAGVLAVIERRRTFDQLSLARAAAWAAMVGATLPIAYLLVFFGPEGVVLSLTRTPLAVIAASVSYGALGGALAAGTVALARRAPPELEPGPVPDDGELLCAPPDG
jgi:hypothetical protein